MTKADWLAYAYPEPLLDYLGERATDRKRRLFEVACCRRVWHVIRDDRSRAAVAAAERNADVLAGEEEMAAARLAAEAAAAEALGAALSAEVKASFCSTPESCAA